MNDPASIARDWIAAERRASQIGGLPTQKETI